MAELSDLELYPPERITCFEFQDPIVEKSLKDGLIVFYQW